MEHFNACNSDIILPLNDYNTDKVPFGKGKKSSLQLLNQDCVTHSWPLLEQQCVGIIAMVKVFNWIKGEPKHFAISP